MPLQYKTPVPAPAPTTSPSVSASAPASSSLSPSLALACQSPSWSIVSGRPPGLFAVVAIVTLVVVAVQRLRTALHSRRHASRAVSSMSQLPARPAPAASQPYGEQLPQRSQLPEQAPSQKRRDQPRATSSSISYSRPLITVPLATSDRPWPPPPPMPTLAMLQSPAPYQPTFGARDEYYSPSQYQSPDQYGNQYQCGYPPFSAGPYPPPPGLWSPEQQERSAAVGAPPRFSPGPAPPSSYTYPPYYPLGPLPPAETTVLPPLHPDVTDAPLPGKQPSQPQPQPQPQAKERPQPPPPPSRTHRRSYSQKIIYPRSYSPGSQSTSKSAPELGRDMRDADPLITPGGTVPGGSDAPEGEVMGIEVSEEIIVAAEGWRRHTRVYGGGVCMACLESEAEMKERGINLDAGPILMEGFDPSLIGRQQPEESVRQDSNQALGGGEMGNEGGEGELVAASGGVRGGRGGAAALSR